MVVLVDGMPGIEFGRGEGKLDESVSVGIDIETDTDRL
jgi:hypothetical protein